MKVSELWLREWVNPSLNRQELAEKLTMAGLEVDALSPVAKLFTKVKVAQILKVSPHPQATKLNLCQVSLDGENSFQIVCGASNVRAGLKTALAQIDANLPGDLTIKETTLRGELSQGMLCSWAELGVDENAEGIIELDDDAPLGMDLRQYLTLDDYVLDIDLTPNRADCFSVLGIAREIAVLTNTSLKPLKKVTCLPSIDDQLIIKIESPKACPYYCGRIIRNIKSQVTTPYWMIERLKRSGIRPIHPVVDITNYVMIELGQPMHGFDYQKIKDNIIVRFASKGESLKLLDGQPIVFKENTLVIADNEGPLAIAGIMGGEASSIQEETQDIFLESALFNPVHIAGVARQYGLLTDSSQRFERGVDPALPMIALEYATQLILAITGGEAGPISQSNDQLIKPICLVFKPERVKQLTGLTIAEDEMMRMLKGLGMQVTQQDKWQVIVPTHRFDIQHDVDLIEEIVRLYGYDKIIGQSSATLMQAGHANSIERLGMQVANFLVSRGYHETISYSFVDPNLQQEIYPGSKVMELLNPISSELSQMRQGMWPGLIASMIYNIHRQQTAIKFFEMGVTFNVIDGKLKEQPCLAGLVIGEREALNWAEKTRQFDFFDVKGDLEALLNTLHLPEVHFVASQHPALHPGKSAKVFLGKKDSGWCGVLHPRLAADLDIQEEIIVFELLMDTLIEEPSLRYEPISKFPQIRRDLSLLVDNTITAAQIEAVVRQTMTSSILKEFSVFDVYVGESIPKDKKSLAIALILQDEKRTLIDEEINAIINAIIKALGDQLDILLRE